MTNHEQIRPRIGLLALTLELYETLVPDLRQERETWLRRDLVPALEAFADVAFDQAVCRREDVDAAVAGFEAKDADALVVVLLSYSPSVISLPALKRTRLPIIIWNTQELHEVNDSFSGADMTANHGVHGTQDLANVLLRSGVRFEYVTSHINDENATDELKDFAYAASAVHQLGALRIGLLGYPFPGMGDFAVDTTDMTARLGCDWTQLSVEEYIKRSLDATPDNVTELVAQYREKYVVADDVTDHDLDSTARAELALRGMVKDCGLGAVTYQFLAFGDDERTPTLPFVAASRMMGEGLGFGGEGDLIAAAGTFFLNRLMWPASFTEIFTTDFGGNSLLLSHMGEMNAAMVRRDRKPALCARPTPITRTKERQLTLVTGFEPGPATLCALTLGPDGNWRLIASRMTILDFGPIESLCAPNAKIQPDGNVRDFLTAYAKAGGPHHNALCFGDARARLAKAAALLSVDYCEV